MWVEREDKREIRMSEEWGGIIPSQVFLDEARRIVEAGKKEGDELEQGACPLAHFR